MSIIDTTTYASVTSVSWKYAGGCPRGDERVLWGQKIDPVVARRVMADCLPRSEG